MNRKQLFTLLGCCAIVMAMSISGAAQAKKAGKAAPAAAPAAKAGPVPPSNADALDLNTASLEKLMTLTNVDIGLAKKIGKILLRRAK